jgi:predicted transcriptional regulator
MFTILDSETKPPTVGYILSRTSDKRTFALFYSIASSAGDRSTSLMKGDLTTKQYYRRISGLMNAGLIRRYKGKYSLTLLGTVVYYLLMTIYNAIDNQPKLRAI